MLPFMIAPLVAMCMTSSLHRRKNEGHSFDRRPIRCHRGFSRKRAFQPSSASGLPTFAETDLLALRSQRW
jgi:hypothetical protein